MVVAEKDKKLAKYPRTEHFSIVDTIGVPHPYCITPKHVGYAADQFGGMLGTAAIEAAEAAGVACDICKRRKRKTGEAILSLAEHEQALLVNCKIEDNDLLKAYLLECKPLAEADKFAGFAFKKDF